MAESSIHFESGSRHFFFHNDRTNPTKNAVFFDEKNEILFNAKEAVKMFDDELRIRSAKYTKRTGQKLQKNATTHLSAIINLEQHHTLNDIQKIAKKLEEELDTKVLQISIHRDEGRLFLTKNNETLTLTSGENFFYNPDDKSYYFDDEFKYPFEDFSKFKIQKNYHAHIEMMGLDSQGISLRQNVFIENNEGKKVKKRERLDKNFYSKMQTFTAESLGMKRGKIYGKKAPKHIQTNDFKKMKAKENRSNLVSQSLLKRDIKILREKLRLQGAKREQYAKLEQLNRDLQERIKAKDLTIRELEKEVSGLYELAYEDTYERYDEYGRIVDRTYSYKEIFENAVYYKEVAQTEARELKWKVEELEEKLNIFNKEVTNLKEENSTLKEELATHYEKKLAHDEEFNTYVLDVPKIDELKKRVEELEKENVQLRNGFNIDINAEMMNLDFDDEDDEIEEKIYKQHVIAPKRRNMP